MPLVTGGSLLHKEAHPTGEEAWAIRKFFSLASFPARIPKSSLLQAKQPQFLQSSLPGKSFQSSLLNALYFIHKGRYSPEHSLTRECWGKQSRARLVWHSTVTALRLRSSARNHTGSRGSPNTFYPMPGSQGNRLSPWVCPQETSHL